MTLAPEVQSERLLVILGKMIDLTMKLQYPHQIERRSAERQDDKDVVLVCWTCAREVETSIGLMRRPMVLNVVTAKRHRDERHVVEVQNEEAH